MKPTIENVLVSRDQGIAKVQFQVVINSASTIKKSVKNYNISGTKNRSKACSDRYSWGSLALCSRDSSSCWNCSGSIWEQIYTRDSKSKPNREAGEQWRRYWDGHVEGSHPAGYFHRPEEGCQLHHQGQNCGQWKDNLSCQRGNQNWCWESSNWNSRSTCINFITKQIISNVIIFTFCLNVL